MLACSAVYLATAQVAEPQRWYGGGAHLLNRYPPLRATPASSAGASSSDSPSTGRKQKCVVVSETWFLILDATCLKNSSCGEQRSIINITLVGAAEFRFSFDALWQANGTDEHAWHLRHCKVREIHSDVGRWSSCLVRSSSQLALRYFSHGWALMVA